MSALFILSLLSFNLPAHKAKADTITHSYKWTQTNSANDDSFSEVDSTKTDSNGNIYTLGRFSGTVTFDRSGGHDTLSTGGSDENLFLSKYAADGSYLWTKTMDLEGSGNISGTGLAIDGSDNIYFTGYTSVPFSLAQFGSSDTVTPTGSYDSFVTKLNTDGTYGWTRQTGAAGDNKAQSRALTTDSNGNVYVTGEFLGTINFDPIGSDSLTSGNSGNATDAYLSKYNGLGDYQWTVATKSSSGMVLANTVATNSDGSLVYIAGNYTGTTTFDRLHNAATRTASNGDLGSDFMVKFGADSGLFVSNRVFDTSSGGAVKNSMVIDGSDNIYITGLFYGTVVFDGVGGSDSQSSRGVSIDNYLTKINADGSYGWTRTGDDTDGAGVAVSVATDWRGNVYSGGSFFGTMVFDGVGGSDSQTDPSNDGPSGFVTSYDSSGNYRFTQIQVINPGSLNQLANNSITTYQDFLYTSGFFRGTGTFNGVDGTNSQSSGGNGAGYLTSWQLGPQQISRSNQQIVKITSPTSGHTFTSGNIHVTGTSTPNLPITVKIDNKTIGTTTADLSGNWDILATKIKAGSHTIVAQYATAHSIAYMSDYFLHNVDIVDINTHEALATIPDVNGNSLAVSSTGKIVASTGAGSDACEIKLIDSATSKVTSVAHDTGGCYYTGIAFSSDGNTAFVNKIVQDDNATYITEINLQTGQLVANQLTSTHSPVPAGIGLNEDGSELWVVNPHTISVYNSHTLAFKHSIDLGDGSYAQNNIVFANGKAYVSDTPQQLIRIFTDDSNYTELTAFSDDVNYTNLAVNPSGTKVYAISYTSKVTVIDTSTDEALSTQTTQQPPESIAIAADGANFVVGDDHSSGEVYFGSTSGNSKLTDGIAFDGGSFYTLNSDFVTPLGTTTFSDSVGVTVKLAKAAKKKTSLASSLLNSFAKNGPLSNLVNHPSKDINSVAVTPNSDGVLHYKPKPISSLNFYFKWGGSGGIAILAGWLLIAFLKKKSLS